VAEQLHKLHFNFAAMQPLLLIAFRGAHVSR